MKVARATSPDHWTIPPESSQSVEASASSPPGSSAGPSVYSRKPGSFASDRDPGSAGCRCPAPGKEPGQSPHGCLILPPAVAAGDARGVSADEQQVAERPDEARAGHPGPPPRPHGVGRHEEGATRQGAGPGRGQGESAGGTGRRPRPSHRRRHDPSPSPPAKVDAEGRRQTGRQRSPRRSMAAARHVNGAAKTTALARQARRPSPPPAAPKPAAKAEPPRGSAAEAHPADTSP